MTARMNEHPIDQLPTEECGAPEVKENPELCWKCQGLLNSRCPEDGAFLCTENWEDQSRVVRTSDSIKKTARRGCFLCLQLLYSLSVTMRATLSKFEREGECSVESFNFFYRHFLVHRGESQPPSLSLQITPIHMTHISMSDKNSSMDLLPASEFESFINLGTIEGSTSSQSTCALIATWVEQCTTNHKLCNPSLGITPALPSRVIDIGFNEHTSPRLLVVDDQTPLAPYTTMSHCWGSHIPFKLSSNNFSALQKEIPVSDLPKTYQDGIITSRRLGVRYLWIDSLCIIQDSEKDWREQSAFMGRIYSDSYCNIAAAHAANGTYGCFTNRDPDLIKPRSVDLNWGPHRGTFYAVQSRYWHEQVLESPVNRRAWVCQERFLAPRIVYFGEKQVYWECRELAASEQFPSKLPPTIGPPSLKGIIPHEDGARMRSDCKMPADPTLDAFSVWDTIVARYSAGQLTYPTDKLVALSGLAVEMHKHIQSQYLAGMWRKHLEYQLLWNVPWERAGVSCSRPKTYVAPSWSWASSDSLIEHACHIWSSDNQEILIEISDVEVEVVDNDEPFGQVKSGFLRIRGSLAKAGMKLADRAISNNMYRLFLNGKYVGHALFDVDPRRMKPSYFEHLHYLPIQSLDGLILRPEACETPRTFTRVGIYTIYGNDEEFKSACRKFSQGDSRTQSEGWGEQQEIMIL